MLRNPEGYVIRVPSWSPDGRKILFEARRDSDDSGLQRTDYLSTIDADGTNIVRLTDDRTHNHSPAWSPDGTKIAFISTRDGNPEVYVMNADGTSPVRLTETPSISESSPKYLPDNTRISFLRRFGALSIVNADGTNPVDLGVSCQTYAWSPDGTKIAYTRYDSPNVTNHRTLYVRPVRSSLPTPTEHGDTEGTATAVAPDSNTLGGLERAGDVDYFRVEVARAGRLMVDTSGGTDTFGSLRSANGATLAEDDDTGSRSNFYIARDVAPGTYYVVVLGSSNSTTGAYTLRVGFTARDPSIDHGHTRMRATLVGLNTNTRGVLEQRWSTEDYGFPLVSPRDADYFRVEVDRAGRLTVETTGTTDTWGYLLLDEPTEMRFLLADNDSGNGSNFRITREVLPGTYYVVVVGYGWVTGAYTLRVGFTAGDPSTDHGDTRMQATLVGLNSNTPGSLERAGDVDYFCVEVARAGRLTVDTSGETDTFGVFQSAQGRILAEDDDAGAGTNFRIARDVSPGTYYVEVTGYDRTATGAYTLRIAFTPAEGHGNTERGDRRATLLNLSPWQAWVHLYCLKDRGPDAAPCAVTFECNGQSGEPVAWPVTVAPKTIFSYWPNKTASDGTDADLQAALIAAGKPEDEARRRTTCEVFSPDPLTVRGYTLFGGQPTLVPVAEPARPEVAVEPGERRRQATLPNLSPGQAWVHLYCLKDRAGPDATPSAPCAVTFECNGQTGEPVSWPVEVGPKTIFSYWPNKTVDGTTADLQAALIAAGKPEDEARRRTTCEVFSADPIAVRGYTRFGGQPTLVPVPAYQLSR